MEVSRKTPDWRAWLSAVHPDIQLREPATDELIDAAQRELRVTFHSDLRSLLIVTNGVVGPFGYWLVWPAEKIVEENRSYRTMPEIKGCYMPFDHLLFIGEVGNGDLFAYPIMGDGNARYRNDIFRWDHETDNRTEVATSLRGYIEGFVNGTIEA